MIAIAFYLCLLIGVAKEEIAERLPKNFRKDRMNYQYFKLEGEL
ncbi:hypothetical protein ACE193_11285 [Bernardetia sp. OM2101]